VARLESKRKRRLRAERLGERIRAEDGPGTSVRLLEEFVAKHRAAQALKSSPSESVAPVATLTPIAE
jgi:hypothetical protein